MVAAGARTAPHGAPALSASDSTVAEVMVGPDGTDVRLVLTSRGPVVSWPNQ
jgi:hypothetical protein